MYQVWLEGVSIPRVMKVEVGNDRSVKEYNGVGKGKYTLADSKGIRTWTMKTEQVSPELFALFEETLANKEESRLVIVSEAEKTSVRVLLESYTKEESFAGVYDSTVKFKEYIPVGIRTTDVPYVARPGKVPTPTPTSVSKGSLPSSVFHDALTEARAHTGGGGQANKESGAGRKSPVERAIRNTWYASDTAVKFTDSIMSFFLGTYSQTGKKAEGKIYFGKGGGGMKQEEK